MKGLTQQTAQLFEKIAPLSCLKPFVLVGGTAVSLQLHTRMSEDLVFMRWKTGDKDKLEVGWLLIKKELETIGTIQHQELLGLDHVTFWVDDVKLSFYAAPRKAIPSMQVIPYLHNIRLADVKSICAMKMELLSRRNEFRDYYDIYSILKSGIDINEVIPVAISHSGHMLRTKDLMLILTNGNRFRPDKNFQHLSPLYSVTPADIESYIKSHLQKK